ncbi:MAG: alpha,2-mannosyltransferase, partial [Phycisphaerales bacterium]|nr:alpha,2-mannosyltransferase [Phycisphaerales bacterium]
MIDQFLRRYHALLLPLAIFCILRLIGFACLYTRDSLQVDFAAMYHAGASMRAGLDPYDNNVDRDPTLWDGVAAFRHSRFLYPPIVAYALQPISKLSYPLAKAIWTFASLVTLAACMVIAVQFAGLRLDRARWLLVIIVTSLLFPLLPFLERGQIDSWTLLFISVGFYLIFARKHDLFGGAVMAVAGFIKLQCFYLLPLLFIARRPRAAIGMMISIVAISILQVLLCGPALSRQYVFEELPRISRHGEVGAEEMRIDSSVVRQTNSTLPSGDVRASGKWQYRYTLLPDYAAMSNLVPYVRGVLNAVKLRVPTPLVSVPLLLVALVFAWRIFRHGVADNDAWGRLALMHACLIIVLLTAPITWTTNLVWLAPLAILMLFAPELTDARRATAAAVVGYFLLLIPDAIACDFLIPRLI